MRKPESAPGRGFGRQVWKALLLIILSAVVGTGLLILSEFLPAEPMDRNLEHSADIFQATGKFPNLHTWCSSRLDNYSDAIMLMMAGNVSAEHPVEYAMMSYHPVMGELDPVQIITRHYIEGVPYEEYEPYSRYWHGYGIIYRLLLQLFDYHRIRQLNMALQAGLILVLCAAMYRAGQQGKRMILPLLISYGMLAPAVMGLNLEYSLGFYVSLFSVLTLLVLHRKGRIREKEYLVLLFSGIGTAYWDGGHFLFLYLNRPNLHLAIHYLIENYFPNLIFHFYNESQKENKELMEILFQVLILYKDYFHIYNQYSKKVTLLLNLFHSNESNHYHPQLYDHHTYHFLHLSYDLLQHLHKFLSYMICKYLSFSLIDFYLPFLNVIYMKQVD